jgi:peptidoglycan/LPS O-acetylase OafA/YrhL
MTPARSRIAAGPCICCTCCRNFIGKVFGLAGVELGAFTNFFATLLLSIVAAGLSYRYFESRFLRMKGRFERGASSAVAARP